MKVIDNLASTLAKALKKPILYLAFPSADDLNVGEILKAAPYLDLKDDATMQSLVNGCAYIVCDSDEERDRLYDLTVGDDGPTHANSYDGPCRIYALTIDKNGQALNENT